MVEKIRQVIDFLVVDDQVTMLRAIRNMLKNSYPSKKCETVLNGQAALEVLKHNAVKFMITDWNMPKLDGIELVKIIRKNAKIYDLPILMVSDELSKEKFLYAIEERVDGYQLKPFSEAKLISAVDSIIGAREKQTPLQRIINRLRYLILVKKFDDAIAFAKETLAQESSIDVSLLLGDCHVMKKEYDQAKTILKEIVASKPVGKAFHVLGRISVSEEKYEEALFYFNKAIEVNPLNLDQKIDAARIYFTIGKTDEAENIFGTLLQDSPTYMTLVEIGKVYLERGDIDMASTYLDKAFDGVADFVGTYIEFGVKLLEVKDFEKAIQIFKKCLKSFPDNINLLFLLGKTYVESNNFLLAKPLIQRVLQEQPGHKDAKKLLEGHTNVKTGES